MLFACAFRRQSGGMFLCKSVRAHPLRVENPASPSEQGRGTASFTCEHAAASLNTQSNSITCSNTNTGLTTAPDFLVQRNNKIVGNLCNLLSIHYFSYIS